MAPGGGSKAINTKRKGLRHRRRNPLLYSHQCNRKCNRWTDTTPYPAQLDANRPKDYSALPSRLSWAVCGDWSSSKSDSNWSRKLLSWQRDRGFDPHPLRQTKLARAVGLLIRAGGYNPQLRFSHFPFQLARAAGLLIEVGGQHLSLPASALFPATLS